MSEATVSDLSKFLFEEVFTEEMVDSYQKANNIDLKREFDEYFKNRNLVPKFNLKFSKWIILDIIDDQKEFFESAFKSKSDVYLISLFDSLDLFKYKE